MTCWRWRLWRFAWARCSYDVVGGARRLWWRLWWLRKEEASPASSRLAQEILVLAKRPMHWCPDDSGYPLCGATRRELWTREFEFTTCEECKKDGSPLMLQWTVSNR